jgi:hypothetical protein
MGMRMSTEPVRALNLLTDGATPNSLKVPQ